MNTTPPTAPARSPRSSLIAVVIVVTLAVVSVLWWLGTSGDGPADAGSGQPTDAGLEGIREYEVKSEHVISPVDYEQEPPAGGPHNPLWLNCGVYDEPVPNENAVHSMEHGAVWITYDPALGADDVATLEAATPDTYAILSPYEGLPSAVVISAWGRQLLLDSPEDPRLEAFMSAHRMGGVAPEIGAPCTGSSDGTLPLDAVETM